MIIMVLITAWIVGGFVFAVVAEKLRVHWFNAAIMALTWPVVTYFLLLAWLFSVLLRDA